MNKAYSMMIKAFNRLINEELKLLKKVKPLNTRLVSLLDCLCSLLKNNDYISNISKLDMDNFEDM